MGSRERGGLVLVLGGGPAGLATALCLVRGGAAVVLVERGRYDEARIGEHLSPQGIGLLRDIGFSVSGELHVRCAGVDAWWGSGTPNHMDYLFHPVGYGVNLARPEFDSMLAEQCRSAGAQLFTDARLISAERKDRFWITRVQWQNEIREYRPAVIVDATGRSAAFARAQRASIEARDRQVALIAFRSSERAIEPASARVVVESVEPGWWYFAPLRSGRCVCMFITDADLLDKSQGMALATWEEKLRSTHHVRTCIEAYPKLAAFVVRAARSQRISRMAGPGWLAVGDAAISFDPLSSHGIAKGFKHGVAAAQAILAHLNGHETALQSLADRFAAEFADYEQLRLGYYTSEPRWPDAQFWRRRRLAGATEALAQA